MSTPHRIEAMHVCVATAADGDEGVMGWRAPTGDWMPLVASDRARLESIVRLAKEISRASGVPFRVLRFSNREEVETP